MMIKKILSLLIIFSLTAYCYGATEQFYSEVSIVSPSNSSTTFAPLNGVGNFAWEATENDTTQIVSAPCTYSGFKVRLQDPPGSGNSWQFVVRKNNADTALDVTISGTDTDSSLDTDTVTFAAGDKINLKAVPTSSPVIFNISWTIKVTPDTDDEVIILGNNKSFSSSADAFHPLDGSQFRETSENGQMRCVFPMAGTMKDLYAFCSTAPGVGDSWNVKININAVASGINCTISGSSATTCNDTVNTAAISAGDILTIFYDESGFTAASEFGWGAVFVPSTTGSFLSTSNDDDRPSTGATQEKTSVSNGGSNWTTSDTLRRSLASGTIAKKIYADISTAPGAGNSRTFNLRIDGADSGLSCTISGAGETDCNDSGDVTITVDEELDIGSLSASSPAATFAGIGVMYGLVDPPVTRRFIMID